MCNKTQSNEMNLVEMAAEAGAAEWLRLRDECAALQKEIDGLLSDRESLTEIVIAQREALQRIARACAVAEYKQLTGSWLVTLREARAMAEKTLRA